MSLETEPRRRPLGRVLRVLAVAAIIVAAAGTSLHFFGPSPGRSGTSVGGPFRLQSQDGGTVDSADLLGKPYGIFFGFTHCPEVCPTTLSDLAQAFGEIPDLPQDFRVFFVSVDPERDTPAVLKEYTANFDPRIVGLWAPPAELAQLAKAFGVYYEKIPTSDGSYTMNHTAVVYLMDAQGKFKDAILYSEPVEGYVTKLKRLLAGD